MDPRYMRPIVPLIARSLFSGHGGIQGSVNVSLWMRHPGMQTRLYQSSSRLFSSTPNANSPPQDESKAQDPSAAPESATEENGAGKEGGGTEVEQKLRSELDKAVSENATLLSKSRELEDKYKRALAETENLRTRLTKQINEAKLYAVHGFCKDMTEISDILKMAIDSVPKDQLSNDNPHLKNLYDGLAMTESRLYQVFKSHGLAQINPVDEKFNPNEHEAVVHQPVEGKESGTVIFVSKMGYKLHDRVIRPAVVGVAK